MLIAESELNRAQLSLEWMAMTHGIRGLSHRVRQVGAWASAAAALLTGLTTWRSRAPSAAKSSWLQKLLNGARWASTIWFAFRARGQKEEPE